MRGMDIEYHISLLESRKYLKFGKVVCWFWPSRKARGIGAERIAGSAHSRTYDGSPQACKRKSFAGVGFVGLEKGAYI